MEKTTSADPKIDAQIDEVGPCKKRVRISITGEQVQEEIDKQYVDIIQGTQFPGFRKGKAPRRLIEKRFGDKILEDVKQTLVVDSFEKALEDNNLTPLGEPDVEYEEIELVAGKPLEFEVTVEVKPTFDLPDTKSLEVERVVRKIGAEEVKSTLEHLAKSRGAYEPSKAKQIKEDDLVLAETSILQNGKALLREENDQFIPTGNRILGLPVEELAEKIKAAKVDEELVLEVEIPKSMATRAKLPDGAKLEEGKVEVHVIPKELKRLKTPKLDDEFAKQLDFDSLDELKESVKKQLEQDAASQADRVIEEKLLDQLLAKTSFDIPEGILSQQMEASSERERLRLQMEGVSGDEMEARMTDAESKNKLEIADSMKKAFILEKLAKREKIFVTEEMVEATLHVIAAKQGRSIDQVREAFSQGGQMSELRSELRERMTREALRKSAKIVDKKTDSK